MAKLDIGKLRAGILDGAQICEFINVSISTKFMSDIDVSVGSSVASVVNKCLHDHNLEMYAELMQKMIIGFKNLVVYIKVHVIHRNLDRLSENLGDFSEITFTKIKRQ